MLIRVFKNAEKHWNCSGFRSVRSRRGASVNLVVHAAAPASPSQLLAPRTHPHTTAGRAIAPPRTAVINGLASGPRALPDAPLLKLSSQLPQFAPPPPPYPQPFPAALCARSCRFRGHSPRRIPASPLRPSHGSGSIHIAPGWPYIATEPSSTTAANFFGDSCTNPRRAGTCAGFRKSSTLDVLVGGG